MSAITRPQLFINYVLCIYKRQKKTGLLIYVVMKQWRLRKAANKLAHFEPGRHLPGGCPASVPLNGTLTPPTPGYIIKQQQAQFECEISPSGSRRLQASDGSRGSDSEFNAGMAAPGSEGHSRDLKPSKSF